jgi:DNA-binding beta-propeller fold protein YncE
MKRRNFLVAAAAPLVAAAVPERLLAAGAGTSGGGVVAIVTADLESHLVVVDTGSGRIVKRIVVAPGPRSIESNGFGQALVAHTAFGRVSILDTAGLTVVGEIDGLGEPRYAAMHRVERLAYVSESKRGAVAVIDLVGRRIVGRVAVPGPARHLSLSSDGLRLWVALGTKARAVAVVDVSSARQPRLVRTVRPPFLTHDVVWASGDEHVWVTSGERGELAVYAPDAAAPLRRLHAGSAPQHVAFSGARAYVASGEDGSVRVHRLDGSVVRGNVTVPTGSYNISFGEPEATFGKPVGVTPSLDRGTVCVLAPGGTVRHIRHVARSAHDACVVEAG